MDSLPPPDAVDAEIGARIKMLRADRGFTIEELAQRSGVSRAMISRIERGESSATAQLLNRLCGGLGITLSGLFARDEREASSPLSRFANQATWRDPDSGYVRRRVSPASADGVLDLVEVVLPPGATVPLDTRNLRGADQLVYVLEGELDMILGEETTSLSTGDCLHMRFDTTNTFSNSSSRPVRYLVALSLGRKASMP
jgi:transcriptional regulator with XRE-family HTH domain